MDCANTGDWKQWTGLPILPVPERAAVDVKLRSGAVISGATAKDILWGRAKREVAANDNLTNGGEVVAYRLSGEVA